MGLKLNIKKVLQHKNEFCENGTRTIKNNIKLKYSSEVEELIAAVGFDKDYGARPLQLMSLI